MAAKFCEVVNENLGELFMEPEYMVPVKYREGFCYVSDISNK